MESGMFDIVTVGHFTIDLILSPKIANPRLTLGGPPTYVSLAARQLGARVSVISKVGKDFPNEYIVRLKTEGVDLSGLKLLGEASSTKFILKYEKGRRRLQLRGLAPSIHLEDISDSQQAKIIHVAPVANELSLDVIIKLRKLTDVLSFDPQGFVRRFDAKGKVRLKTLEDIRVLQLIDVYKSSINEIRKVTGLEDLRLAMKEIHGYGARIVIVTRGMKGSALLFEGKLYAVPACKPKILVDPTGAGDAFTGAFLAEYLQKKNPTWCACVGSSAASFVTEGVGPTAFGEKKEIYKRATEIYEKRVKQLSI